MLDVKKLLGPCLVILLLIAAAASLTTAAQPRTLTGVVSGQKFGTNLVGPDGSVTFEADSAQEEQLLAVCGPGQRCKVVVVIGKGDVVTQLVSAELAPVVTTPANSGVAPPLGMPPTPSFACDKATHKVELLICANAGLAELDRALASRYAELVAAEPDKRVQLRRAQREWMQGSRAACGTVPCLDEAYRKRIAELAPK